MLTFLFHRFSAMRRIAEGIGLLLLLAILLMTLEGTLPLHQTILFGIVLIFYLFIRYCASRRWYRVEDRYLGIELHFLKSLIPTGYILTFILGLFLLFRWSTLLIVAILLLGLIAHINIILITFHRRDRNSTPVNYFSAGRFPV